MFKYRLIGGSAHSSMAKSKTEILGSYTITIASDYYREINSVSYHLSASNSMPAKRQNLTMDYKTAPAPKVLIVDDNEINVKVLAAYLKPMPVEIIIAQNGENALRMLEEHTVDIIFMDLHMPIMNGYQTTETIRSQNTVHQKTPIIGITADGLQESIQKCMQSGMNQCLIKPIIHKDIEEILKTWLFKYPGNTQNTPKTPADLNNMMIRELPEHKHQLEHALQTNDYPAIYATAHKITGGSAYCNFLNLRKDSLSLQTAAKSHNKILIGKCTRQLLVTIDSILKNSQTNVS